MSSCQYRKSHCGDKTILRPSYLHNGISYTGKTTSLYWIRAQMFYKFLSFQWNSNMRVTKIHTGLESYFWRRCWKLWIPNWDNHDEVMKWKHSPRYWTFVRVIHRSPVNSPYKGQWRGALIFSLICAWINGWVYTGEAGDLRHHRVHYDVTVMISMYMYITNANLLFKYITPVTRTCFIMMYM